MSVNRPFAKRYRSLVIASLISGGSLLNLLPALADQNSATPGDITNQATAEFQDAIDNSTGTALSNTVKVTVVEVAGISAIQNGFTGTSSAYRGNTVYFEFKVKNEGNDPSKLFIPAKPSVAKIGAAIGSATDLAAGQIGQLKVIKYNATGTGADTALTTGNAVDASIGSSTADLGISNAGSISPGGYVIVQVPITLPSTAVTGEKIFVTLGNIDTAQSTNSPYVLGKTGTATTVVTDLYTVDNVSGAGETAGAPFNGDGPQGDGDITKHRQETAVEHEITIVDPPTVSISGTVWDDANGSGTTTFTGIQNSPETFAAVSGLYAVLVNSQGKVVQSTLVSNTNGTYTFSNVGGLQTGLYVVLSTTNHAANTDISSVVAGLPVGWAATTPLSYSAITFDTTALTNITGKDFGIDRLPVAVDYNFASPTNPVGGTYTIPLSATDLEDATVTKFKITVIPNPTTQGTFYYNGAAVTATTLIDTTVGSVTFVPVPGSITVNNVTYVAIDQAGKESTPANITLTFNASNVGIQGTVWHDKNASAAGTFTTINQVADGEVGTDTQFGTTLSPIFAILIDMNDSGKVKASQQVSSTGTYIFNGLTASAGSFKVLLSTTAANIGDATPTEVLPDGWVATSPLITTAFPTSAVTITKDFGVRQKAKVLLLKRITKINGATTNPNDNTVLTSTAGDTVNPGTKHWPSSAVTTGAVDAGKVKPGDTIEYTIYFINNQGSAAKNVKLCDPIIGNQTFDSTSPVKMSIGGAAETTLTGVNYNAGSAPTGCNVAGVTGSSTAPGVAIPVVTGATTLPAATGPATAASPSFGYFKFTTKVKP
jgi:uncharacterized repeat protein (TIGR01451 family)